VRGQRPKAPVPSSAPGSRILRFAQFRDDNFFAPHPTCHPGRSAAESRDPGSRSAARTVCTGARIIACGEFRDDKFWDGPALLSSEREPGPRCCRFRRHLGSWVPDTRLRRIRDDNCWCASPHFVIPAERKREPGPRLQTPNVSPARACPWTCPGLQGSSLLLPPQRAERWIPGTRPGMTTCVVQHLSCHSGRAQREPEPRTTGRRRRS
jgi:hypothetical protein